MVNSKKKTNRPMKKILALSVIIALVTMGCAREEKKIENPSAIVVSTTTSVEKDYIPMLNYSGNVVANKEASLGATLPGKVEKMYFSQGADVQKGALLAELSGELLTQAIVEHDALQKDFERISRLKDKGSMSQMEYDHIKASLDASEAKVEMMKKNTQVVAPFTGTIVDILVHEGENFSLIPAIDAQNMSVNTGIIKLMQLNPIKVTVEVNEKELSRIKTGQKASIRVDAFPGKTYEGRVNYIKPVLSSISRTATVEIEVNNPYYSLKPGMYANVSISLPSAKGIFIPISSVYRQEGTSSDFVFTVINNKAQKITIRQIQSENEMELIEGIPAGAIVVSGGKSRLSDGSVVEIQKK